ncbi:MAG: flavin reductase family protein [Ruminococcus sp.]|nr:flavin reductase family protein [Ruminococcus sp.]
MGFKKVQLSELNFNPFTLIGKQWMLLTGGNKEKFNTMTASWGQLGVLWNKDILTCYIRPNRYTYEFVENGEYFTASFLGEQYRDALKLCGAKSGRDCDKAKEAGITPVELDGCVGFDEADMVFVCRKLYAGGIKADSFLTDEGLAEKFYGSDPLHKAYIAEITAVYVKE